LTTSRNLYTALSFGKSEERNIGVIASEAKQSFIILHRLVRLLEITSSLTLLATTVKT